MEPSHNNNTNELVYHDVPEVSKDVLPSPTNGTDIELGIVNTDCYEPDSLTTNESKPQKKSVSTNSIPKGTLTVDEMMQRIGEFGKAQKIMVLFLYLIQLSASYQTLSWHFTGYSPAWKCSSSSGMNGECNVTGAFKVGDAFYKSRCGMQRSSWEYTESVAYSIVTEWDLICEKKEYPFITNSVMYIGWMIGAFIMGGLSHKYGRKLVLYLSWLLTILPTIGCALSVHYWMYTAFAFVVGFGQAGVYLSVTVMSSEMVGPKYRNLITGAGFNIVITISVCLFCLQAWLIRNWRTILLVTSVPYLVLVLSYRLMYESVRWLNLHNRSDEAEKIIQKIAQVNKKPLPTEKLASFGSLDSSTTTQSSTRLMDIFKYKVLVKRILIKSCSWFVGTLMLFGLAMASDQLGGGIYRDFVLTMSMGIPASFISKYLGDRAGRKPTLIGAMGMGSIACAAIALINPNSSYLWAKIVIGMFGQLCILITQPILHLWSAELLPTVIRSQGMGIFSAAGRIGAITVPWIAQWLKHIHYALPFAVIGGFGIIGTILTNFLPETNHMPTLETFEAVAKNEEVKRNKKIQTKILKAKDPRLARG